MTPDLILLDSRVRSSPIVRLHVYHQSRPLLSTRVRLRTPKYTRCKFYRDTWKARHTASPDCLPSRSCRAFACRWRWGRWLAVPARLTTAVAAIVADLQTSSERTRLRSPRGATTALPVVEGLRILPLAESSCNINSIRLKFKMIESLKKGWSDISVLTIRRITLAAVIWFRPALDGVGGAALVVEVDHVPVASGHGIVDGLEDLVGALGSPAARVRVLLGARNKYWGINCEKIGTLRIFRFINKIKSTQMFKS